MTDKQRLALYRNLEVAVRNYKKYWGTLPDVNPRGWFKHRTAAKLAVVAALDAITQAEGKGK